VVDGDPTFVRIPPPGFDPLTAPPTELQRYGIPLEPPASDPADRAKWITDVSHMWWSPSPPSRLIEDPSIVYSSATSAFAGYYNTSGTYTSAAGSYSEPYDNGNPCGSGSAEATWVGLQGSTFLAQGGTTIGAAAYHVADNSVWYENYPSPPVYLPSSSISVSSGQYFKVTVSYSSGVYHYSYENETTGQSFSPSVSYPQGSAGYAMYMVERPQPVPYLTNFGTISWGALTNGEQMQYLPYGSWYMSDNGASSGTMAATSGLSNNDWQNSYVKCS
jgi:hypothetical protein